MSLETLVNISAHCVQKWWRFDSVLLSKQTFFYFSERKTWRIFKRGTSIFKRPSQFKTIFYERACEPSGKSSWRSKLFFFTVMQNNFRHFAFLWSKMLDFWGQFRGLSIDLKSIEYVSMKGYFVLFIFLNLGLLRSSQLFQ